MLTDHDFDTIVAFLQSLPRRTDTSSRSTCWQTADQFLSLPGLQQAQGNERDLDAALCARFLSDEACPIRPAYYPGEDNCKRLWGHKENVGDGPGRGALRDKLEMKPHPLEADRLPESAPTIFISHALADHHFAARVRLNLARYGRHAWVAEGEMHEGANLFEAIEAALDRCDALMILISSVSISSAWIYTETMTAIRDDKKVVALIDASDIPVCILLRGWMNEGQKREGWLATDAGIQACSAVLERYMHVTSPTRVLKFWKSLEYTLSSLTMTGYAAFYPDVPAGWEGTTPWQGFESALDYLGIR